MGGGEEMSFMTKKFFPPDENMTKNFKNRKKLT